MGNFRVEDGKLVEIPEPLTPFEIKRRAQQAEWEKTPRVPFSRLSEAVRHMAAMLELFIERHSALLKEVGADTDRLVIKLRVAGFSPEAYAHILKRLKSELQIAKSMTDSPSRNLMIFLAHFKAHEDLQDKLYTLRDYQGPAPGPKPKFRDYLADLDGRLQEAEPDEADAEVQNPAHEETA